MTGPRPEVIRFVEAACPGARLASIAGDASARKFWRVYAADGSTRVVMDYGCAFTAVPDDVRLARVFGDAGLRVADVLDVSGPAGCLLLEDLGGSTLESVVSAPGGRLLSGARQRIEHAVVLAARMATLGTPALARSERRDGPALDAARFRFEMDFFLEHYVGGLRGCGTPPASLRGALHDLADGAADTPRRVLCHRDFHSRNLMVLSAGDLAMVDIQDARWGPDSYDLASLLRDAYIEIDDAWIDPLVDLYVASLGERPAAGLRSRLARVSAQRMLKALGTFGYQARARNAPRYLEGVPRTQRRLKRLLPSIPEAQPLFSALDRGGLLEG